MKEIRIIHSKILQVFEKIKNYYTLLVFQFVVIQFINENEDCDEEDDTLFEVGLTKWLVEKLNERITKISWSPRTEQGIALKRELDVHPSWPIFNVIILKLYGMFLLITWIFFSFIKLLFF